MENKHLDLRIIHMDIMVNGELHVFSDRKNLHDLVQELNFINENIAIAINNNIIPKNKYLSTWLNNRDSVEIVMAFYGG